MLFCQQTQKTHSYYHLGTAEMPFILTRISRMHQTTFEVSIACCRLLPHTHHSPSLSWCRSLCQKWELFFVEPQMKSQWTVLVGYLTISTSVSCYQTRCRRQYYLPFSNTALLINKIISAALQPNVTSCLAYLSEQPGDIHEWVSRWFTCTSSQVIYT